MCGLLQWLLWIYPELRMGQMLINAIRHHGVDLFYMSDRALLEHLIQFRKEASQYGRRPRLRRRILRRIGW
jgi:hypothetical protein